MPRRSASAPVSGSSSRVVSAGGDLVRIGHAVDAGEGVVGEDRVEVEVLGRGSKFGRSLLLAERRVDVQQARLERLRARACRTMLVSRSNAQALSTLTVGITREALRLPSGSGWSIE